MAKAQTDLPEKSIEQLLHEANVKELEKKQPATQTPVVQVDLEGMSVEELKKLVRLCNAELVGYALLSKEEKKERLRLKVYAIAMGSGQDAITLKAANDWLDREEGKATQRIQQETTVSFDLKANPAIVDRFRQRLGGGEAVVIDSVTK